MTPFHYRKTLTLYYVGAQDGNSHLNLTSALTCILSIARNDSPPNYIIGNLILQISPIIMILVFTIDSNLKFLSITLRPARKPTVCLTS